MFDAHFKMRGSKQSHRGMVFPKDPFNNILLGSHMLLLFSLLFVYLKKVKIAGILMTKFLLESVCHEIIEKQNLLIILPGIPKCPFAGDECGGPLAFHLGGSWR